MKKIFLISLIIITIVSILAIFYINYIKQPIKQCPTCPLPTDWSDCIDNKQTRTNYRCSAETNYKCQPYIEEESCEIPLEKMPRWRGTNIQVEYVNPEFVNTLKLMGVNSVRIFNINYLWTLCNNNTDCAINELEKTLGILDRKGIESIILFKENPKMELTEWKSILLQVVETFKDDDRIIMWDVANEPDLSRMNEIKNMISQMRKITKQKITIGGWKYQGRWHRPEDVSMFIDYVDVLSPHIYLEDNVYESFKQEIRSYKNMARDKPVIIQEFGVKIDETKDEGESFYRSALKAVWESDIEGVFFWSAIPRKESQYTIIRPDGTWTKAAYIIRDFYKSWE